MKDITNMKFGRLTAIKPAFQDKYHRWHWLCKCDCGNTKIISANSLQRGVTKSCGCLDKEKHITHPNRRTHGMCGTRIYRIWKAIKNRVTNKNAPDFQKWYGSRGITICEEWKNDFMAFYRWAMANGYNDTLSIDRIDVNSDYTPNNCRWATTKQQNRNTRQNIFLTYNGETHCLADWAGILGIKRQVLQQRYIRGWDAEKILTQKVRGRLS